MPVDVEAYRPAILDARFQTAVLVAGPPIATRYQQIEFFRKYHGDACAYVSAGVELCIADLMDLGFKFEDGCILSPAGEQMWPMK